MTLQDVPTTEHPLLQLAREFRERDKREVDSFNHFCSLHGATLEARLSFAEARLLDVCSVLAAGLEAIAEMDSTTHAGPTP